MSQDEITEKLRAAGQQFVADMAPLGVRLRIRATMLAAVAVVLAALAVWAGLSMRAAMFAFLAVLAWVLAWPMDEQQADAQPSAEDFADGGAPSTWRALVSAMPGPVIVLDPAGTILNANARAVELFDTLRVGGHAVTMSRDPEFLAAIEAALTSRTPRSFELHRRIPVEQRLLVALGPVARQPAIGKPALLISVSDLTEQDSLARMRADFVANASHELRTPLASLKGYVETLQGSAKDDPAARARFLAIMSEQAERMARLVDDLLSLSRVEMREFLAPAGEVELGRVLAEVVQSVEPLAKEAGITLSVSCEPAEIMVRGERDEMVQVFQNLVQNAVKYGRAGGRVDVRMAREAGGDGGPDRVRVAVTDDGPGIAPYHLPRLTERFYRVSAADSRAKGGTGLGLAIVKHILNRHRGELRIESTLGRGSTFTVVLPGLKKSSESNS